MNRTEKAELIETLQSTFGAATSVVVTHQTGMTVAESSELRQKVREAGANYRVTKNRVTKIALQGTQFEGLTEFLAGLQQFAHLRMLWLLLKPFSNSLKLMIKSQLLVVVLMGKFFQKMR